MCASSQLGTATSALGVTYGSWERGGLSSRPSSIPIHPPAAISCTALHKERDLGSLSCLQKNSNSNSNSKRALGGRQKNFRNNVGV